MNEIDSRIFEPASGATAPPVADGQVRLWFDDTAGKLYVVAGFGGKRFRVELSELEEA